MEVFLRNLYVADPLGILTILGCAYQAYICPRILSFGPIVTSSYAACCSNGLCTAKGCAFPLRFSLVLIHSGCPYNRICDGTNDAFCCDDGQECMHTALGRAFCATKAPTTAGGAGAGAGGAVTVTTGPPPPFGTYGGYTAAGRPITYPGYAPRAYPLCVT